MSFTRLEEKFAIFRDH